jgi:antitoxin HicB
MKTTIPCKIIYSQEDNCWYVESPGFYDGIMTDGNSLDDAKAMAAEAVGGLLETYLEHDFPFTIPPVTDSPDWYEIPLTPGLAFALWLRKARLSRSMTLADVADKMGVKYQAYQKLENPRTANPTLKTLKKLERVFDTELVAV